VSRVTVHGEHPTENNVKGGCALTTGGHKEKSSILADQWRPRIGARMRGGGGCGVSANEYSCTHRAQKNFGYLTPYLPMVNNL
jgi:hypothetical protein